MGLATFKTQSFQYFFAGSTSNEWRSRCRNWWLFHQISKLNKLAVMALICPCLHFFMAHQCRTWCPSSIGEGRSFSFLPPRETTIRVQQAPEIPGITADEALSISGFFTACCMTLIKPKTEVLHCSKPFLLELWKNKTTQRKDYASWKLVFSSFCASDFFSCRLDFCVDSTHLGIQTQPWWVWCLNQWGSRLSPLDPSGHSVPAKLGKMHARHVILL